MELSAAAMKPRAKAKVPGVNGKQAVIMMTKGMESFESCTFSNLHDDVFGIYPKNPKI